MLKARYLSDLLPALSVELLLDAARATEVRRSGHDDVLRATLVDWLRADAPELWATPYQLRAGLAAREAGIIAYDRLERAPIAGAASWRAPGLRAASSGGWTQDGPTTGLDSDTLGQLDQQLMQTLVGFGWWPGMSEWELMHLTRLAHALGAFQRHYLAQLGRLDAPALQIDQEHPRPAERERLAVLDRDARDPEVRSARLESEVARVIADRSLQMLGLELYAFRSGIYRGTLVEPNGPYLELGNGAEYARAHLRRLRSATFQRYLEHCLTPGRDYATDAAAFEMRAAAALVAMLSASGPSPEAGRVSAERARRVLADVGRRLCHLAGLRGDDRLFQPALDAVAQAIATIESGAKPDARDDREGGKPAADDHDDVIGATLDRVAGALDRETAFVVLALGYAPTRAAEAEPEALREIRVGALVRRAWLMHPAVGAALDGCRVLADKVVQGTRAGSFLEQLESASAAHAAELPFLSDGYFSWLRTAFEEGEPGDAQTRQRRWHYRLACRQVPPDAAEHGAYEVAWNPYLKRMPLTFDAVWNAELMRATPGEPKELKPKPMRANWYCYVGPGRDGPVYLPIVPRLSALLFALRAPKRLDTLMADPDFGPEFMRQAVADEAVLLFHKPPIARPERPLDFFDQVGTGTDFALSEPVGPWHEAGVVSDYALHCKGSAFFEACARALCGLVGIDHGARVGELGVGSGVLTRLILADLSSAGRVVAVDPGPLLVARVARELADPRVRYEVGGARALAWAAVHQGGFDRLLAHASIWRAPDVSAALLLLGRAAAPQARLAFSLPAGLLAHSTPGDSPEAGAMENTRRELEAAMGAARAELRLTSPPLNTDRALGSFAALTEALARAGWVNARFALFERPRSVGEHLDWLALRAGAEPLSGEQEEAGTEELVALVRGRVDERRMLVTSWYLVTAERQDRD